MLFSMSISMVAASTTVGASVRFRLEDCFLKMDGMPCAERSPQRKVRASTPRAAAAAFRPGIRIMSFLLFLSLAGVLGHGPANCRPYADFDLSHSPGS